MKESKLPYYLKITLMLFPDLNLDDLKILLGALKSLIITLINTDALYD